MKTPTPDDMEMAADWLICNEGPNGESEACSRVATWLRSYALDAEVRKAAREAGCSVKYLRKIMARERSKP